MKIADIQYNVTETTFFTNLNMGDSFEQLQKDDKDLAASLQISDDAQKRFEEAIVHLDRSAGYMPEYCGIYRTDKAIASAVEGCSKEEQAFVYDIIRKNFLLTNTSSLTEEERRANISLGMKKAEYASQNIIPEKHKEAFLNAMTTIAKLASAGKADKDGNMNYGTSQGHYLGHGSQLVETTDTLAMMKNMDSEAYEEYQRIGAESSDEDRALNKLKYLTNWYINAVKDQPDMVERYEKQKDEELEKRLNNQKVSSHFADIDISSKESFLNAIRKFMAKHDNFMSGALTLELANKFWNH